MARISERQADRLRQERVAGVQPDDFLFKKEDLIGPEPSSAIAESAAWKRLQSLVGLKAVKEAMQGLLDRVHTNYQRELEEKNPVEVSLNRVFLGSPGTGKTSVGILYGQVLADMGLLSNGEGECLNISPTRINSLISSLLFTNIYRSFVGLFIRISDDFNS